MGRRGRGRPWGEAPIPISSEAAEMELCTALESGCTGSLERQSRWMYDLGEEETRLWEKSKRLFCHRTGTVGAGEELSDRNSGVKAGDQERRTGENLG